MYHVCVHCGKKRVTVKIELMGDVGDGEYSVIQRWVRCSACDAHHLFQDAGASDHAKTLRLPYPWPGLSAALASLKPPA